MFCSRREDAPELVRDSKNKGNRRGKNQKEREFLIQGSLFW